MATQFQSINIVQNVNGPGIKERIPVKTIALTNLNLASNLNTVSVSGYTLVTGDRFIAAGQTTSSENGIYVVGTTAERSMDYLEGDLSHSFVTVTNGTYQNTEWQAIGDGTVGSGAQGFKMKSNMNYSAGSIISTNSTGISYTNPVAYKVFATNATDFVQTNDINLTSIRGSTTNNLITFVDNGSTDYLEIENAPPLIKAIGSNTNVDISLQPKGTGTTKLISGGLNFYDGVNYTGLRAGTLSGSTIFYLPVADGTNGQHLQTNGSGQLSFAGGTNNFVISADAIVVNSPSTTTIGYFTYYTYPASATITLIYEVVYVTNFDFEVYDATNTTILSTTSITTSGFKSTNFTAPATSARLEFRVKKTSSGGSSTIYGINMKF